MVCVGLGCCCEGFGLKERESGVGCCLVMGVVGRKWWRKMGLGFVVGCGCSVVGSGILQWVVGVVAG